MYGFDHTGMGLGAIGMILLWLVPIALLAWLFARTAAGRESSPSRTPLEVLDERYARGEIGQEEYRSRRDDLLHRNASHGARQ